MKVSRVVGVVMAAVLMVVAMLYSVFMHEYAHQRICEMQGGVATINWLDLSRMSATTRCTVETDRENELHAENEMVGSAVFTLISVFLGWNFFSRIQDLMESIEDEDEEKL